MHKLIVLAVLLFVLAACEQTATPLPVALSITETPAPTSEIPRLRFAYSPDALALFAGRDALTPFAELLVYDPQVDFQTPYDVVIALGQQQNLTLAPSPITVKLAFNADQPPLDDLTVEQLVRQAFDPAQIATGLAFLSATPSSNVTNALDAARIRTELANAGYPDGVPLTVIDSFAPGGDRLPDLLRPFGINVRLITADDAESEQRFRDGEVNAVLSGSGGTWLTQIEGGIIDLYTVPISYRAAEGLALSFDAQGFPVLANSGG